MLLSIPTGDHLGPAPFGTPSERFLTSSLATTHFFFKSNLGVHGGTSYTTLSVRFHDILSVIQSIQFLTELEEMHFLFGGRSTVPYTSLGTHLGTETFKLFLTLYIITFTFSLFRILSYLYTRLFYLSSSSSYKSFCSSSVTPLPSLSLPHLLSRKESPCTSGVKTLCGEGRQLGHKQ